MMGGENSIIWVEDVLQWMESGWMDWMFSLSYVGV